MYTSAPSRKTIAEPRMAAARVPRCAVVIGASLGGPAPEADLGPFSRGVDEPAGRGPRRPRRIRGSTWPRVRLEWLSPMFGVGAADSAQSGWALRKQSEQYTGRSMRGRNGTWAWLPHSEQS